MNELGKVKIIQGTIIYAEDQLPVPGADIQVKGTDRKTETDLDGKFKLKVREGEILIVSFVAMGSTEVLIDAKDFYKIILPKYIRPMSKKMKREQRRYLKKNGGIIDGY
jgi:hypothetical protein